MKKLLLISLLGITIIALLSCGCTDNGAGDAGVVQHTEISTPTDVEEAAPTQGEQSSADSAVDDNVPIVYMTRDISPEGLMAVYEALDHEATGNVAIKLHMGEPGNTNYLSPDLVRELVTSVDGTFVDSNTYYGGPRASTAMHLQVAEDHGFTYAPVDILDADGEISLPVNGGKRFTEALVGSHYDNYDSIISIAHFKGHTMAGFGGSFKNIAVGIASVNGKEAIHDGSFFSTPQEQFLEDVVEYAKAIVDDRGDNIVFINVLNKLSVDCDCMGNAAEPEMADIGILASLDPVAIDKASVDLVYASPDEGKQHLIERIEARNGTYLLDYAEQLGVGSQEYELVTIDG